MKIRALDGAAVISAVATTMPLGVLLGSSSPPTFNPVSAIAAALRATITRVPRKDLAGHRRRPSATTRAETTAMLVWALLASGQITMRKVDDWGSLTETSSDQTIDLAA